MENALPAGRSPSSRIGTAMDALERLSRECLEGVSHPVTAIIVGGAAVHLYTCSRVSSDVEAAFSHRFFLPGDLLVRYQDSEGRSRVLTYDSQYSDALGLMHPDYRKDAIPLTWHPGGPLQLAVLSPVDLVVSKLARYQDHDRADILALAEEGLVSADAVGQRAREALDYYVGRTFFVEHNIAHAVETIRRAQVSASARPTWTPRP